jgi:hypothetical protein
MSRRWHEYDANEPLPINDDSFQESVEEARPRRQDSNLLLDGSTWIKVPVAIRRGKRGVTIWVQPIRAEATLESITDSGRSTDNSEYHLE